MCDFAGLEAVVKANEAAPDVKMAAWIHECGTVGCLVGNFCLANKGDSLHVVGRFPVLVGQGELNVMKAVRLRFALARREVSFLFAQVERAWDITRTSCRDRQDGQPAIDRLKKFIAYKRRKAELLTGGTPEYELARQSGHVGVVALAAAI